MNIAENCVVAIEYELTEAGQSDIIDSNKGQAPLEFITGKQHIIPGLESQLMNLSKGESADLKVSAVDAYGELNPEAVDTVPKEQFADIELEVGMQLFGQGENGEQIAVIVKEIADDGVTIDYNHPLAGKDLMFSVTVSDVRAATEDEIATGMVGGGHDHGEHCGSGNCSH
jgi:FKBP-type peptidyl-prolyl cis-trans isomerase SlyD